MRIDPNFDTCMYCGALLDLDTRYCRTCKDREIAKAMRENLNLEMPPRRREGRMDFMKDEEMPKIGLEPKGNQFGLRDAFEHVHGALTEAVAEKDRELFKRMKNKVQTAIALRGRATQAALNFVGHSISSSDGSYELLIQVIYDALQEVANGYRKILDDIHFRAAAEAGLAEFGNNFWDSPPPSVSGNEGHKVPVEPIITEEK